jgi:hypothetical protein
VASHGCREVYVILHPGETIEWSWKAETQLSSYEDLSPVVPGAYRIQMPVGVTWIETSATRILVAAQFRIL